jgi:hypothetical protein
MAAGAAKPARFATELIRAIPQAAAEPDRKRFGNCQKTGIALIVLTIETVSATRDRIGLELRIRPSSKPVGNHLV